MMTAEQKIAQLDMAERHAMRVMEDEPTQDERSQIANAVTLLRCAKHLIMKRKHEHIKAAA